MTTSADSRELEAAQARLFAIRASLPPRPPAESTPPAEPPTTAESNEPINWELVNAQKLIAGRQQQAGITPQPTIASPPELPTVTHYPDLGAAAICAGQSRCYRVWLFMGHLDAAGSGRLSRAEVKTALTDKKSPLYLYGWRNLQEILKQGAGRYWHPEPGHMLRRTGREALAADLGLKTLTSKPILLPIPLISGSLGDFNAHCYVSWLDGLDTENPISRAAQEAATGINKRAQRRYGQRAGLAVEANIAIEAPYSKEEMESLAGQHGHAVFIYKDWHGHYGPRGRLYIARHLPNSYPQKRHQRAPIGRWRKVKRGLPLLVENGVRGNGRTPHADIPVRYEANGAAAAKRYNRQPDRDVYYIEGKVAGYRLWRVLPRRGRGHSFFDPRPEAFDPHNRGKAGADKSFIGGGQKLHTHPQTVDNLVSEERT